MCRLIQSRNTVLVLILNFQEFIPHFSPNFLYGCPKKSRKVDYETFCRCKLLEYQPGSSPENLLGDGKFKDYEEAMEDFIANSPHCPSVLKELIHDASKGGPEPEIAVGLEDLQDNLEASMDFPDLYVPEECKY